MTGCPARALEWAETALGEPIRHTVPLTGGWTSTMLLLTTGSGREAVLRLMTREPWRTHAAGLLAREAQVQHQLASTLVPAPRSIAVDPSGRTAGTPAHLMSRLPGHLELGRSDRHLLIELADLLVSVHRLRPEPAPRTYESWAEPAKRVVPAWAAQPALWREAFALLEHEPPAFDGAFLHRDFHLGNVLWTDARPSGLVDWVETSWGPVDLDVAHARTNLAMLHGPEAASAFGEVYDERSGRVTDATARAYWDAMDVVGFLPDPVKVVQPWRDQGVDVSDDLARSRLEAHLASVVRASSAGSRPPHSR